uniref:Uncharacterized protein n=1 Tax=Acrobeloides nanus TaxID=290746 RepID=A0A914D7B5_9BILA
MDATCMSGFTPGCLWGPYFIDVEIPDEDVKTLGESAIFSYKDRKVKIPKIHRVPPRESGLAV